MDESVLNKDVHEVKFGSVWRNNKNEQLYEVKYVGTHTETREKLVVYRCADDPRIWIRPAELFREKFTWQHA